MAAVVKPSMALIFVSCTVLLAVVIALNMKFSIVRHKESREGLDDLVKKTSNGISGERVIRGFNKTAEDYKKFEEKSRNLNAAQTKAADFAAWLNPLTYAVVNLAICLLIYRGAVHFNIGDLSDGQVVETAEFTFQELVKPLAHKKVSPEITELTGITNEAVYDARPIWEVLPDFMKFVGDAVLLGFNCVVFDSRFMVRAGRYSNLIIENKYFDVMRYADRFKDEVGFDSQKVSLGELAEALNIENPHAHRALADAITTAKIFLKFKSMESGEENIAAEDLLSDLDDW